MPVCEADASFLDSVRAFRLVGDLVSERESYDLRGWIKRSSKSMPLIGFFLCSKNISVFFAYSTVSADY